MDGRTDGDMYIWMDGWMDGRKDGRMDESMTVLQSCTVGDMVANGGHSSSTQHFRLWNTANNTERFNVRRW